MCDDGGWNPVPQIINTVSDAASSIGTATREAASEVKGRATLENVAYALGTFAPNIAVTNSGREKLLVTSAPYVAPAINAFAPGMGSAGSAIYNQFTGQVPQSQPSGDSGWGSLFSVFRPGTAPVSQGAGPQESYTPAVGGGTSWLAIAGIGAALVAVFVLLFRSK